jgi:hypothetical protein
VRGTVAEKERRAITHASANIGSFAFADRKEWFRSSLGARWRDRDREVHRIEDADRIDQRFL